MRNAVSYMWDVTVFRQSFYEKRAKSLENLFSNSGNPILMIFFKQQEINVYKQTFSDQD